MKHLFFLLLFGTAFMTQAQDKKLLKTADTFEGSKHRLHVLYDHQEHALFVRNDGMNGPLMLFANDYDKQG